MSPKIKIFLYVTKSSLIVVLLLTSFNLNWNWIQLFIIIMLLAFAVFPFSQFRSPYVRIENTFDNVILIIDTNYSIILLSYFDFKY